MLVLDVGQLLALYFSLVVPFHSHIYRLFWCVITVTGFWDGNNICDDDDDEIYDKLPSTKFHLCSTTKENNHVL